MKKKALSVKENFYRLVDAFLSFGGANLNGSINLRAIASQIEENFDLKINMKVNF